MGCQSLPVVATNWPLGVDLLLRAGRHAKVQTLLQFFTDIVESSGYTHEQRLRELRLCDDANVADSLEWAK
jgi:hypothetical protein